MEGASAEKRKTILGKAQRTPIKTPDGYKDIRVKATERFRNIC